MPKTTETTAAAAKNPLLGTLEALQSKIEIPEAARAFVAKATATALEQIESAIAQFESATATLEANASGSTVGVLKAAKEVRGLVYDDAKNGVSTLGKLADAKTLADVAQVQMDFISGYGRQSVTRAQSAAEYMVKSVQEGMKIAQNAATAATKAVTNTGK